jgi:hypothetical protein
LKAVLNSRKAMSPTSTVSSLRHSPQAIVGRTAVEIVDPVAEVVPEAGEADAVVAATEAEADTGDTVAEEDDRLSPVEERPFMAVSTRCF